MKKLFGILLFVVVMSVPLFAEGEEYLWGARGEDSCPWYNIDSDSGNCTLFGFTSIPHDYSSYKGVLSILDKNQVPLVAYKFSYYIFQGKICLTMLSKDTYVNGNVTNSMPVFGRPEYYNVSLELDADGDTMLVIDGLAKLWVLNAN